MTEKMSNAPVYYALVQAHFNTVAMKNYVEEIQDRLRKRGYTLFEPLTTTQLMFRHPHGEQQAGPKVEAMHRNAWLITGSDRQSGFIVTNSSLTFHTTHYDTHREFIPELIEALKVVHDVAQLDHVSRVGLRYLNAILPNAKESVDDYLAAGLHGVDLEYNRIQSLHESIFQTECGPSITNGTMITRIHRGTGHLGFPPDLQPHNLVVMEKFKDTPALEHAILDIDHYATGKAAINVEELEQQVASLHDAITNAFEAVSSDYAKKIWTT